MELTFASCPSGHQIEHFREVVMQDGIRLSRLCPQMFDASATSRGKFQQSYSCWLHHIHRDSCMRTAFNSSPSRDPVITGREAWWPFRRTFFRSEFLHAGRGGSCVDAVLAHSRRMKLLDLNATVIIVCTIPSSTPKGKRLICRLSYSRRVPCWSDVSHDSLRFI